MGRAVKHLIRMPSANIGNGIFNLGSNWNPSLLEMAQKIRQAFTHFEMDVRITCIQPDTGNNSGISLDYSIAKLIDSGYQPMPGNFLYEELQMLISYCLQNNPNIST